jgi:glycosyltransferase involved in cell wall biosynthesis
MRVALVAAGTQFHRDTERTWRTRRFAELLRDRGHTVVVCCARWWVGDRTRVTHRGVTYRGVAGHPRDRGVATRLATVLPRLRPDVVHAVSERPRHVLGAAVGARLARVPLVCDWYDGPADDGGLLDRTLDVPGLAARAPTATVTPSRTVETRARERGVAADRTRVVPNPVDVDAIRDAPVTEGTDVVYARRLDGDANLESLLLALAEYRERGWSAAVVGDGPARARYERQAADLRIDDRVSFLGDLDVAARRSLFRGAHVAVYTARRTPFATDLCRALAAGCVGIVEYHEHSSAHELVEGTDRGLLATDEAELVDHLATATGLEHRTLDDAYAAYDEETVTDRLLDCYERARDRAGLL